MKKLSLLFILCMLPMLALAQTDSAASPSNPCSSGSGLFVIPASWDFPAIGKDFSEDKVFTLCNDRSNNITITSIQAAPNPPFRVIASLTTCPAPGVLQSGTHCDITVQFDASLAGQHQGALTIECSGAGACPITVPLSGTAEANVTLAPRSFNFGSWAIGTTSPAEAFQLTNNEPVPLHIHAIQTDPAAIFFVVGGSGECRTSQPVQPGASCNIYVEFSPDETGQASGSLTVTTDSLDGTPPPVSLSGTGTPACNGPDCCPPTGCCPPPCCPPPSGKVSGDICPPTGSLLPKGELSPLQEGPLSAYLHPAPGAFLNN